MAPTPTPTQILLTVTLSASIGLKKDLAKESAGGRLLLVTSSLVPSVHMALYRQRAKQDLRVHKASDKCMFPEVALQSSLGSVYFHVERSARIEDALSY